MSYVYPLPAHEWSTSRTDQGVDFVNNSASSRILAIGNARILSTGAAGWPGGGGVLYELLDGPAKGKVVYAYENVAPQVHAGQVVGAGQLIATMKGTGYPWLEMGWADAAGVPISHGEYTEGKETQAGKSFKDFLARLPKIGSSQFSPAERRRIEAIAGKEGGTIGTGIPGEGLFEDTVGTAGHQVIRSAAGAVDLAGEALSALQHPEKLLLNAALLGGGAFLVYYGAARMLGVRRPVATPAKAAASTAAKGAALA